MKTFQKVTSGFSICALSFQGLQGSLTCIFIRGGQEGEGEEEKKVLQETQLVA